MSLLASGRYDPTCSYHSMATFSFDGNVRRITFSESVLTMESDLCVHGSGFNLMKQRCMICLCKSEQFFKTNSFMLPLWRVVVKRIMCQFTGINTDALGNIGQFQKFAVLFSKFISGLLTLRFRQLRHHHLVQAHALHR